MGKFETKQQRARKDHKCSWCELKINKGEIYENTPMVSDGFYVWKSHLDCKKLTNALNMWQNVDFDGLTSDDFERYIFEEARSIRGDIYPFTIELRWKEAMKIVSNKHLTNTKK